MGSRGIVNFQYYKPSEGQIALMQKYRDLYEALYKQITSDLVNPSVQYELDVCITKLEESAMWLNKHLTREE